MRFADQDKLIARKALNIVAEQLQLDPDVIMSRTRIRDIIHARQMLITMLQRYGLSYARISLALRGDMRHHTTMLYAVQTFSGYLETEPETAEIFNKCMEKLTK